MSSALATPMPPPAFARLDASASVTVVACSVNWSPATIRVLGADVRLVRDVDVDVRVGVADADDPAGRVLRARRDARLRPARDRDVAVGDDERGRDVRADAVDLVDVRAVRAGRDRAAARAGRGRRT